MKKTFFSLLLLFAATAVSAQIVKGDMDGNGQLTIADATRVVDVVLGNAPQENMSPYTVDNSLVAGTWVAPDGTSFTLAADGTTTYPGAATYRFRPYLGTLLFFTASGIPMKKIVVDEVEIGRYLLTVNSTTSEYAYYTTQAWQATGISLDQTSLSLNSGTTAQLTFSITPADAFATIAWSSSDESVATVSQSGLVTAKAGGSCTITARATGSGMSATCLVTVDYAYVDLGLPSGTLWATCNIGADSPEDYGDYFAWGEKTGYYSGKTNFSWDNYKWCNGDYNTLTKYCDNSSYGYNGFTDTKTELDPEDDAAYVNWGANWRMPTIAQFEELINSSYTTTKWTTQNGVYGRLITSNSNGNSLFLPAAGWRDDSSLNDAGSYGVYWSRTLSTSDPYDARYLYFDSGNIGTSYDDRCYGQSVRPVRLPK